MPLCCCPKLKFWALGRQGFIQMGFTQASVPFKVPLQPNNQKRRKDRKVQVFSDAYISLGLCSRTHSLEDMRMKCFEPTLEVKFTLLKRSYVLGAILKVAGRGHGKFIFCLCNNSLSCLVAHVAGLFQPAGGFPGRACHTLVSHGIPMHLQMLWALERHGPLGAEMLSRCAEMFCLGIQCTT